jgi:hypothetical protein
MGKLALFAATPGMVAGCCYVIDVPVDSIGIVLERTDSMEPIRMYTAGAGCGQAGQTLNPL